MLDLDFHKACLMELMRVSSGEVRIFPLSGLDLRPYRRLEEMLSFLDSKDIEADIAGVPFEFQRGANRMMTMKRRAAHQRRARR
ncbi:MAG: hypothetical protein M0Z67_14845 [Nitrospiraceae bacterium]|nr:hypothetical protein [Nitrospiraceae bacterium]